MSNNDKDNTSGTNVYIAELRQGFAKKTHFSIQSSNTKPYDISKMTGKPTNTKNSGKD